MEEMVTEVVDQMDYLRAREQKLRDTNESTNNRVKWFGFSTTFLLIGLWVWQVLYLRAYFRFVIPWCVLCVGERCTDLLCSFTTDPSILSRMENHHLLRARWHGDVVTYEYPEFRSWVWALEPRQWAWLWDFLGDVHLLGRLKAFNDNGYQAHARGHSRLPQTRRRLRVRS